METCKNGLWDYLRKWEEIPAAGKEVSWVDGRLANSWCAGCRYCCGPQNEDEPFPMALLPWQCGRDAEKHFYLLDACTAGLGKRGCKSHTGHGCKLPLEKRPIACGLFPLVLANGRLHLYMMCPAVLFLPFCHYLRIAMKAARMLENFSIDELRHISLNLAPETLAKKYADLHIRIFDDNGVCVKLD